MIEADTIVRSQNTLTKPELAAKLLEKYKQLIANIPAERFGEAGLNSWRPAGQGKKSENLGTRCVSQVSAVEVAQWLWGI